MPLSYEDDDFASRISSSVDSLLL